MEIALSPLEFARRARRVHGQREAVVDGDTRLNYEQFLDLCDHWSHGLQAMGVGFGDRVAYIAPNTLSNLVGYYAVPQIGAVLVPINYRLAAREFEYILNHCGARVVCVHADYLDMVDSIRADIPDVERFIALSGNEDGARDNWEDYETLVSAASAGYDAPEISENDLITINYTSGTTSRPKGVMMTHRNAYMNVVGTLMHQPFTPADRYLWTLPMFHANGWTFVWNITAAGGTHICLPQVVPEEIFRLMNAENVTFFCAAPTVLIMIANAPDALRETAPKGLKLFTAGAPPAAATIERIEGELGWEITQVYGATETAPFISICEPLPEHDALSASDRASLKARQGVELMTSGELRVMTEDGQFVPHDGESLGEIVVRGNVVMKGYYNDPENTEKALAGGWYHTGDAAVVHPDGYIEIRDRFKDVIISGGENISSVEVEGVLLRHPDVVEAGVVGMPHEQWGESPHAFVVRKPGADLSEEALKEFMRDNLAHFKTPKWFTFVDELPKTATGKIQKFVLRENKAGINAQ